MKYNPVHKSTSFLTETHRLFYSHRQLRLKLLKSLVWWKIEAVETSTR
jgi:hypothetical protein